MPAYCDVDGVPCHVSHELLDAILRGEWGFDGIVVSDYIGVQMLATHHRLDRRPREPRAGPRAGVDIELPGTVGYGEPLLRAVADGRIDEATVDAAGRPHARMKFRLGLFERPYVDVRRRGARRARRRRSAGRPRPRPPVARPASRTTASCRSPGPPAASP